MKRNDITFEFALGTALLTLATIMTVKLLFDMDRYGMYPWQQLSQEVK
jgi:hypothetical protein